MKKKSFLFQVFILKNVVFFLQLQDRLNLSKTSQALFAPSSNQILDGFDVTASWFHNH